MSGTIRLGLLCVLGMLLSACASTVAKGQILDMEILAQGRHSGVHHEHMEVVRAAAAFKNLWAARFAPETPPVPPPAVDFEHDMVVAVFLGRFRTSGHSVSVMSVRSSGDRVMVDLARRSPGMRCRPAQMLTEPFVIAKVPRFDGPVIFTFADIVDACDGK